MSALVQIAAAAWLASCAAPASAPAAGSQEAAMVQVTRADAGQVVAASAGQPVQLVLEGNPTTGFDWVVEPGVEALGKPHEEWVGSSQVEGAGATKRITWSTAGVPAGTYPVRVTYRRRAEVKPPREVFTFTLRISPR